MSFGVGAGRSEAYNVEIKPADGLYVDEPYLSIRWDGLHHHVYSEWHAFASSIELRRGLLSGIQAIRDNHATAYVATPERSG